MKYPTLSLSKCEELSSQMVNGQEPSIDAHLVWQGVGDEVDLNPVATLAQSVWHEIETHPGLRDKDRFEGVVACELRSALADFPYDVIDDPGFWRYLSLTHFWRYIAWREENPFANGNHLRYIDCEASTESVLTRMYIRATAIEGGQDCADLAGGIRDATDFWRSHVLRVRTSTAPPLARAFAATQIKARMTTDPLREMARVVNRTWSNVVLFVYDDAEAIDLIAELRGTIEPIPKIEDE